MADNTINRLSTFLDQQAEQNSNSSELDNTIRQITNFQDEIEATRSATDIENKNIKQTVEPLKTDTSNPIFIDTQGNVKYNTEQDFFAYETSMNIQWRNKKARKVLIYLIDKFNTPLMMFLKHDGMALWNNNHLNNMTFYKKPVLFNEIIIRDYYDNNMYDTYPFLSVYYKMKLSEVLKNNLVNVSDYFIYDSLSGLLEIKSQTLEENIIMLYIFLYKKIKSTDEFLKMKNLYIKKLKSSSNRLKEMDNYIKNINFKLNKYVSSIKNK